MLSAKKIQFIFLLSLLLLLPFVAAQADTLYLKNGRSLEGIIKREDSRIVELEVGFGTITFEKSQIKEIQRSNAQQAESIQKDWQKKKIELERAPKGVEFSSKSKSGSLVLSATLNDSVDCLLILDTGASVIVLKKDVASKLGMDLSGVKPDAKLQVADGRQVNAKFIILKSVRVEEVEAKNVEAAIMLDDVGDLQFNDGLLGMSFLKKFNFKVDHRQGKLILEQY